jgi:hypothetical protein
MDRSLVGGRTVDAVVQTCQLAKKKKRHKAGYARASIDSGARGADSAATATDVGSVVESVVGFELEGGSAGVCADVGSGADADTGAGAGSASAFFSFALARGRVTVAKRPTTDSMMEGVFRSDWRSRSPSSRTMG